MAAIAAQEEDRVQSRQHHLHLCLPEGQSLNLPVCACLLLKAPGKGRKEGGGKDDFDGSDAVRPYTPMSDNSMLGAFELLVKRYDGGAVSQYLHGLDEGAMVDFKHIKFNVKSQYPFEGKKTFTLVCAGTGVTPMYQALWKLLGTEGDDRQVVMLVRQQDRRGHPNEGAARRVGCQAPQPPQARACHRHDC